MPGLAEARSETARSRWAISPASVEANMASESP
jgi:hypothetical protein